MNRNKSNLFITWQKYGASFFRKSELKYRNVTNTIVEFMILIFKNKTLEKIFTLLVCNLVILVGLYFVDYGQFLSRPTPQLLTNLVLLVIIYFTLMFLLMVLILYDRIIADWKSEDLVNQINSVIKTELDNSKFNPNRITESGPR